MFELKERESIWVIFSTLFLAAKQRTCVEIIMILVCL